MKLKLLALIKEKKLFYIWIILINAILIGFLIYLPFYLFDGRLFLGGDDTRLYYAYPNEVLKNFVHYSWNNISSLPIYTPNYQLLPLLILESFMENIIRSKILLFYFTFSSVFIIGFLYFQKLVREIIGKEYTISYVAALIFIFSPITIVSHISHFLSPVWLIPLSPIILYYYIRFIKKGEVKDVFKATAWSIFLSLAYYAIPWLLGLLIPLLIAGILLLILSKNKTRELIKRTITFAFFIITSQLFWIIPFFISLISHKGNDLGSKIVSEELLDSFIPTVYSTAKGSILYPLIDLYHRQIAFDFSWPLKDVFKNFFDPLIFINIIFIIVLFLGINKYKAALLRNEAKVYISFFMAFLIALYLFTVNIGFLKYIFILFGNLPGFSMFRNFTDKFSLGYIFIYAIFLSMCLFVVKKKLKSYPLLLFLTLTVVIINFLPAKKIINVPLWKTNDIYQTVNLPNEYLSFTRDVRARLSSTDNVIVFPQTISAYSIITEDNEKNTYIGTSPFKFLSGVNDLTGELSYPPAIADKIKNLIKERNYENLLTLLQQLNIGYIMVTHNIPRGVYNSYIFDKKYLAYQDKILIDNLTGEVILKSEKGNYILYRLKNSSKVVSSTGEIQYSVINPTRIQIGISNLKGKQRILFYESYHSGWKMYPFAKSNRFILSSPIFEDSHKPHAIYGNGWEIDSETIKSTLDKSHYVQHQDGSIDFTLTLYFLPQSYLYIGILLTFLSLLGAGIYVIKKNK